MFSNPPHYRIAQIARYWYSSAPRM